MDELPNTVSRIVDVPRDLRGLYGRDGNGYKLSPGGKLLKKVQGVIDTYSSVDHSPTGLWSSRKPTQIDLADWSRTLSAASIFERRELLRLAASGRVAIKR